VVEAADTEPNLLDMINEGDARMGHEWNEMFTNGETAFDGSTDAPVEVLRKRPLTVETMLWDGTQGRAATIKAWVGNRVTADGEVLDECRFLLPEDITGTWEHAHLYVDHQQTWTPLPVGHRIAREADDRGFYPLSPEAVAQTYEPA
jgi:hypothetical protein